MSVRTARCAPALALLATLMLAGCGGVTTRPAAPTASEPGERPPQTAGRRGGGYYLDDGPPERIPADLDRIPDAVPRIEPLHRGTMRPYTVLGRSYVPMTELKPFRERGIATWYGRRYHGKPTSSGEPYDMFAMSAAHTTLPIPSYARVTNLRNGRSVIVRINDRGPFVADRVIDLSYTAAHRLQVLGGGSALVEVEAILPDTFVPDTSTAVATARPAVRVPARAVVPTVATPAPPSDVDPGGAPAPGSVFLQLGAFGVRENAERFLARMQADLTEVGAGLRIVTADALHRVQAGPFASRDEARRAAERIGAQLGAVPVMVPR